MLKMMKKASAHKIHFYLSVHKH